MWDGISYCEIETGTGIDSDAFWQSFESILNELAPQNKALLEKRDAIQAKMDDWYKDNAGPIQDMAAYKAFLTEIGYLVPEGDAFSINTSNVDDEIATIAGPQLVVPVNNARFALNAAQVSYSLLLYKMVKQLALKPQSSWSDTKGHLARRSYC